MTLARSDSLEPIQGQHRVGPDGTVNMGMYGTVYVTGMTVEEARKAIETRLTQFLDQPQVSVDVYNYASKVYYVIGQGAGTGDTLTRLQITGNETVLDAISQINGLSRVASKAASGLPGPRPAAGDQRARRSQLGGDHERCVDSHELPDHAGRPDLHRGRQGYRLRFVRGKRLRRHSNGCSASAASAHSLIATIQHPSLAAANRQGL